MMHLLNMSPLAQEIYDQVAQLQSQLRDKDQVLEFVESEIQKIREKQDADRLDMEAKDEML